jgi:large subunit ribosomal protein L22
MAAAEQTIVGRAQAKSVRSSARKARLIVDHIRGRSVPEARTILAFATRAVAEDVEKVLKSAVANAEVAAGRAIGDDLVIAAAYVDEGPTLKRWRPRARGRVSAIKKRTCHITIQLAAVDGVAAAPAAPRAEAAATETTATQKPKRKAPAKKKEASV